MGSPSVRRAVLRDLLSQDIERKINYKTEMEILKSPDLPRRSNRVVAVTHRSCPSTPYNVVQKTYSQKTTPRSAQKKPASNNKYSFLKSSPAASKHGMLTRSSPAASKHDMLTQQHSQDSYFLTSLQPRTQSSRKSKVKKGDPKIKQEPMDGLDSGGSFNDRNVSIKQEVESPKKVLVLKEAKVASSANGVAKEICITDKNFPECFQIVNYLSSAEEKERKEGIDVNDISPAVNKDIQTRHSQEGLSEDPMPQENTQYNPKDADQITDGIDVTSSHENTQDNPKDPEQITDGIDFTDGIDVTSSHEESEAIQNLEVCPPKSVSSEIESSVEMNEVAKKYPVFDPILVNVENVSPIQKDGSTELQPNNIAEEIPQTNAEIVQTNKTDLPGGNASHDESIQPHSSNAIDVCDDKNLKVDTELKIKKETLDETAHQQSGSVQTTITKSMVDEEEKFKSEVVKTEVVEQLHQASQRQRYDRLQILLDRSQIYAKYLLDRINARSDEENKCKEKQKKRKKKVTNETIDLTKGKRKREEEVSDRPEDYIDKAELEERIKRQKLDKENCSPKVTEKDEAPQKVDTFSRTINGKKVSDRQPKLLTGGVMREYQLDGMEWLHGLFENGINGILADEMGLGKTIQSIALITSLIELNVVGPFIIAAPLSTLPNWINEFKKFTPELKTMLYHGTIEERENMRNKLLRLKRYSTGHASLPIVISSYEILMRDRPCFSSMKLEWKYLIVDEGHRIKNLNSKLIKELKLYKTANRLLLTGTPLQNNLSELWSLLNFLLPDIFDDLSSFQSWFDFSAVDEQDNEKLIAQEKEANVLQKLHSILTPFLLRRLKTDVDLSIPPKKEVIVYAPLTAQQQLFYKTTLDRTIIQVLDSNKKKEETVEYTPSGRPKRKSRVNRNYAEYDDNSQEDFDLEKLISHVEELEKRKAERVDADLLAKKMSKKAILNIRLQNVMMQLRKCCNHPYLLEYPFDPATQQLIVDENVITSSGKMLLLDRMIAKLKSDGHKVLIFSQMTLMLDIIQDFCSVRNYKYSRIDGSMNILARQENIKNFEDDPEHFIFLLSTRAGGLGLNLMMADTCIIFDSDWNPQQDLQAQDRCHRIGQTKPVVVYRFVTANTIDQRIIERAASKRKLEKMVIHKKNFKGGATASLVSPKELLELLESKDAHSTMEAVISDADLAKLLDRSDLQDWDKNKKASSGLAEQTNENTDPLFKVVDYRANDVVI